MDKPGKIHIGLFVVLILFFLGQGLFLVHFHSLAEDEAIHQTAGILYLRTGNFEGGFDNPPLVQLLFGLPYHLGMSHWEFTSSAPPIAGRMVNLLLGAMLCIVIALFSYRLFGPTGALLSLFLAVTSPSIIAHSTITTLDTGPALFLICSFYFLYECHHSEKKWYSLLAALFLALATGTKYTVFVLYPFVIVLLILAFWLHKRSWRQIALELCLGTFIIWFTLSALFLFKGTFVAKEGTSDGVFLQLFKWLAPTALVDALKNKLFQASTEIVQVFLGKLIVVDVRLYAGVLLFKVLPGTLLLLIAFLYLTKIHRKNVFPSSLYTIAPAFVFWFFFNFNKTYCGIRHLLPVLSFTFVALGFVGQKCRERKELALFVALALTVNFLSCLISFPFHMSYFNTLGWSLTKGNFVIGTSDSDYGQEDKAMEKAIKDIPADLPLLLCPTPSMHPRMGYVAVNGESVNHENAYPWLDHFTPHKRIGGSWLLYRLPETSFKSLAKSNSWPHVALHLEATLNERKYGEVVKLGRTYLNSHSNVWPYILQSLIYMDKLDYCIKERVPPNSQRWQAIASELLGQGRGRLMEQQARAMLSLTELSPFHSFPYRKRFFASPLGYSAMKGSRQREIMQFVGSQLFDEKKFAQALPYMLATMPKSKRTIACEKFVKVMKTKKMDDTILGIVHSGPFSHHATKEILFELKRFRRQNPDSYWVIIAHHYLRVLQRRGVVTGNFGFGTMFDRVNEMGHHRRQRNLLNESAHK